MSIMHKPLPQNGVQWGDRHYYLSAESTSVEGRWTTYPYQKAPLLCMTGDTVQEVNWIKSARVGYTKLLCVANAYFICHRRRNGVIYQPTDSDAADFVSDEINVSLRDVSALGDLLLADPEKLSRFNKSDKKMFQGATLDIKGGKSARNFRRLTKDYVIYDELDGFDSDIDNEGPPTSLGDVRITTSSFPKSIRGSTPGLTGASMIATAVAKSDLFFERYLPCPHCDHMHVLRWKPGFIFENNDPETAHFECPVCAGHIFYDQYARMDELGQWQTTDGIFIDDETGSIYDADGNSVHVRSVAFHIWAAYSRFMGWSKIVREFLHANAEKKLGDPSHMKTFVNTVLGETYGDDTVEADTDKLKRHRDTYPCEVPPGVLHLTAGVDIQDDRFEIEICGHGENEESWSIHYRAMYGNLDRPEIWNILEEFLTRTYHGIDGEPHDIKLACIDSGGHYTSEVYRFCARNPNRYIPTKGYSESGKPIATFPSKLNSHGCRLTMIGSDTAKELIYARYEISDPGSGYCHYPFSGAGIWEHDEYGDRYFDMATAEHYVLRYNKRGHVVKVWEKIRSRRNEALDCRVGNLAAIRILQQHYGIKLKSAPVKPAPPPESPPETIIQQRRKRMQRPQKRGFVNNWRK